MPDNSQEVRSKVCTSLLYGSELALQGNESTYHGAGVVKTRSSYQHTQGGFRKYVGPESSRSTQRA